MTIVCVATSSIPATAVVVVAATAIPCLTADAIPDIPATAISGVPAIAIAVLVMPFFVEAFHGPPLTFNESFILCLLQIVPRHHKSPQKGFGLEEFLHVGWEILLLPSK